jgi:hypothetical protein
MAKAVSKIVKRIGPVLCVTACIYSGNKSNFSGNKSNQTV